MNKAAYTIKQILFNSPDSAPSLIMVCFFLFLRALIRTHLRNVFNLTILTFISSTSVYSSATLLLYFRYVSTIMLHPNMILRFGQRCFCRLSFQEQVCTFFCIYCYIATILRHLALVLLFLLEGYFLSVFVDGQSFSILLCR